MKNIENTTVSGRIILERGTESVLIPWFLLWCLHLTHGYQLFTQALFMSYTFQWLNDIENDPTYRSWPTGVQELLRATFPGVIRQIRRNFFNLVSPLKSGNAEGVVMIRGGMKLIAGFIVVQMFLWLDFYWTLWNCCFFRLFSNRLRLNCVCLISGVLHFSRYSQTHFHKREKRDWMVFVFALLLGAVPWSTTRRKCWAGKTSRAFLQAQDPPEVGAVTPHTALYVVHSWHLYSLRSL